MYRLQINRIKVEMYSLVKLVTEDRAVARYSLPEIKTVFRDGRTAQTFVSALLRAIKRDYTANQNSFGAVDTYYGLKE